MGRSCNIGPGERAARASGSIGLSVALGLAAVGCSDDRLSVARYGLVAEPAALDFGEGCVGRPTSTELTLANDGAGVARRIAFRVEPSSAPFVAPEPVDSLVPGRSRPVEVIYTPIAPEARDEAELVVEVDGEPALRVPMSGVGGVRRFAPFPEQLDFGVVNEGSPRVRAFELRNEGGSPLTVRELIWTSTSADLAPVSGTFAGGAIAAKDTARFELRYDPVDLGADRGTLVVFSDDPSRPRVELEARARANLRPRLRLVGCKDAGDAPGCAPEVAASVVPAGVDEEVRLDARDAVDPEGAPLRYVWSVEERPEGSFAAVFSAGPADPLGSLRLDASGRYVVTARARDERGLDSDPSSVRVRPPDLVLVARWNLPTDVDLHLVRPGGQVGDYGSGAPGRSLGSDCSPFNRAPRWGDLDTRSDDPRFERDAVTSRGPESLGLDQPEPGVYRVYAHYCDSRNVRSETDVTVEIWSRGEPVDTIGPMRLKPGELWQAAEITWDAAAARPIASPTRLAPEPRPDVCRTD